MDLAEASGTSLASATSATAATLQAFQLPVSQAGLVTNVLFTASEKTGTSVSKLSSSIDRARSTMGAAAPSISQMGGLLLDLADHGETGRQAMSTLNSAFTGIISPTAAVTAAQNAMGVSFINTKTGALDPLSQIIGELQPKIAGMGNAQATATLKSLGFGSASSKLVSTIQAGAGVFDADTAAVSKAGAAHDAAAKQSQTLSHQLDVLKASVLDAATKWGQVLIPVLEQVGKVIVDVGNYIVDHKAILIALGIAAAAIFGTMLGFWVANTIAAMSFWTAATGGIAILVAALAAGIAWIVANWTEVWGTIKAVASDAWHWLYDNVLQPIEDAFSDVVNWIESHWELLTEILVAPIAPVLALFLAFHDQIIGFFEDIWANIQAGIDDVVGFFTALPGESWRDWATSYLRYGRRSPRRPLGWIPMSSSR